MNSPTTRSPALAVVSPLFGATMQNLIPLGSSNILMAPQPIYQLAFEHALQQLAQERAQQNFRQNQQIHNN